MAYVQILSPSYYDPRASAPSFLDLDPTDAPCDRFLPLYNRRPCHSTVNRNCAHENPPPPYDDGLLQTVDRRHKPAQKIEELPRYRSSFALSDIFELDEDEVEIEILEVIPSSSSSTSPSSLPSPTESTSKSSFSVLPTIAPGKRLLRRVASFASIDSSTRGNALKNFIGRLAGKFVRAGPRVVENDGTKLGLDLVAC